MWIYGDDAYDHYFGFDLGDGESAVAWLRPGSSAEPQLVELRGRKSVLSVVGVHPERGVLIGEEALYASGLTELHARFKSRFLSEPDEAGRVLALFAGAVADALRADGRFGDLSRALMLVGCPSGWDEAARGRYCALLAGAGLPNVRVVSESRAAFLQARWAGELAGGDEGVPTLIADAGSSTTDFTFVSELRERHLSLDFGETRLGGGLIDRLLLNANVDRHPNAAAIGAIFERFPQYRARCEVEARRVKEMYFTDAARGGDGLSAESAVKLYALARPTTLDLTVERGEMDALLTRPLAELSGRSMLGALKAAFVSARDQAGEPVRAVLLTGGVSRMPQFAACAAEVFPGATLSRGLEPEFAIARGLCHALRVDRRIGGFYGELNDLLAGAELRGRIEGALARLVDPTAAALADELIERAAPEAFARWRRGSLATMAAMGEELGRVLARMDGDGALAAAMEPAARAWLDEVRPGIADLTDPLCDRYQLPRAALRLRETPDLSAAALQMPGGRLVYLDELKILIDLMAGAASAALMGGGGVALLAAGPAGLAMGLAIGLVAGVVGGAMAERTLIRAELPLLLRRAFTEGSFRRGLRARRGKLARSLTEQLRAGMDNGDAAERISSAIGAELRLLADRAALRIR
ncbi:MAG: Hsp70 family protein [Clostridiales bacterium]|nr:Hsp70 family protein [Clostridiales bacterium]